MHSKIERVGIIGKPSDWLIASVPSDEMLDKLEGFDFIKIPIEELYAAYDDVSSKSTGKLLSSFKNNNKNIDLKELQKAETFYVALRQLVDNYKLTAFTIRCFDLLIEYQTTGCFALSKLYDEGIIAGCEGDIVSLIGMIKATRKTGKTVWMANPSQIDLIKSELVLAHCTVPTCIVNDVSIDTHFESNQGIGIKGIIDGQNVTLFRLGGKNLDKKFICTGKLLPHKHNPKLCRTQIKVQIDDNKKLEELLTNPLGNHLLFINGKYKDILN
jgi:L-fucose isomerase-like protein